jgi:hypothetical protein
MALLAGTHGGGMADMLCSATHDISTGMAPMYVLMSVFHAQPWLKLVTGKQEQIVPRKNTHVH